jgi:type III secretion system FlhB-like substrate exporter
VQDCSAAVDIADICAAAGVGSAVASADSADAVVALGLGAIVAVIVANTAHHEVAVQNREDLLLENF